MNDKKAANAAFLLYILAEAAALRAGMQPRPYAIYVSRAQAPDNFFSRNATA